MNWTPLSQEEQLQTIKNESIERPILIFKHSTTCPISGTSKARLERSWNEEEAKNIKAYYLDLLQNRGLSAAVAETFSVEHESPQVLLIKDGKSVYNESHFGISFSDLLTAV